MTLRTPACSSLGASGQASLGTYFQPRVTWPASLSMGHPGPRSMGSRGQRLFRGQWKQQSGWGPRGDLDETGNAGGPAQGFLQNGSVARDEHTRSISCVLRQAQGRTSLGKGLPPGNPEGSG